MPNIMITDICNLHCPYCFANEFVNRERNDIRMDALKEALEFVATEKNCKLGLIGGEPTLHPHFREILQQLIKDHRFQNITLYTNGIRLGEFARELSHPKFKILINCNSETDIGVSAYQKMCDNIHVLLHDYYMKERVTLGINLYKPNFEYDYILDLLKKYDLHRVRISIVVPNDAPKGDFDIASYFLSVKPRLKEFFFSAMTENILPYFDCNKIPSCFLLPDEKQFLMTLYHRMQPQYRSTKDFTNDTSILTETVACSPVIDILQDLSAVRCFGLSSSTKAHIRDFRTVADLKQYYYRTIDASAIQFGARASCDDCYLAKTMRCTGGCLAYKIAKVEKLRAYATHMNEEN